MLALDIEKTFLDLLDETFGLLDQETPDLEFIDGEPIALDIEIDKIRVTLCHAPAADPDHFTMYCPFGKLPDNPAAALKRALEMNAMTGQTPGGVMAINPHNSEMMMIVRVALTAVDPASLLVSLHMLSRQALEWRKTHFLDQDPKKVKVAAPHALRRSS